MYDRIIVPIEAGTTPEVLDQAFPLAGQLGCTLTLLHVHYPREAPPELEGLPQYRFQGVVESWDERDLEVEAKEEAWLQELAATVAEREPALTVTGEVVHAPLSRTLQRNGETVLVVAPAGKTERDDLSPTVRELLRAGGVPVLLVRPGVGLAPVRRMIIALDGSSFSAEIMGPAMELAEAVHARISLLEVVTRRGGLVGLLRPGERSAESAERFLRDVRARVPDTLGPVDVRVVEMGNAAAGIATEARREDVDLVAMATHGRGGLRRLIMGSVAESVVRGSRVPVLLYRPMGAAAGVRPTPPEAAATA